MQDVCHGVLCVADQFVYVANSSVHKIAVFTTEGDYVTSFGSRCL